VQTTHQSNLLSSFLLLLRHFLLTNILESKTKGKEERHSGESSDQVKDPVNALCVGDQNAAKVAGAEDLAELGSARRNNCLSIDLWDWVKMVVLKLRNRAPPSMPVNMIMDIPMGACVGGRVFWTATIGIWNPTLGRLGQLPAL
jgi:hypothetical protein